MSEDTKDKAGSVSRQDRRARRLEAQLRENLKRRKEQARSRGQTTAASTAETAASQPAKDRQ